MKFEAKLFDRGTHQHLIYQWFAERQLEAPDMTQLPRTGAVVFLENRPMAIGFLIRTDAGIAVIDRLVTNPAIVKAERQKALEHGVGVLVHMATREGFNEIVISSDIAKLWPRFEQMGFTVCLKNVSVFRR